MSSEWGRCGLPEGRGSGWIFLVGKKKEADICNLLLSLYQWWNPRQN